MTFDYRASVTGETFANEEDEMSQHSFPHSRDNLDDDIKFPHTTTDDADKYKEEEFVFSIDQSLLVDPRHLVLGKIIGEGSYSTVYEGLYKSQPVAVKVIQLSNESAVSRKYKEKFQREVLLLSRINHENILKFVGASVQPDMMIITELMGGNTLKNYLRSIHPNHPDQKLSISFALDISRAMEYLHANGIIHRDLKPSNLLLSEDNRQIKIADFGEAREEVMDMTCEAGTYRWMAPEIFSQDPIPRGVKKQYDHKVDVYSFALVLWELLTNKVPFKGKDNMAAAYAASKNERPSLEALPEDMVSLLQSCWAADPNIRPEFSEITAFLTKSLQNLSSTEVIHPQVNESEDIRSNKNPDFSATAHIKNKSNGKHPKQKRFRFLPSFLKRLCGCFRK